MNSLENSRVSNFSFLKQDLAQIPYPTRRRLFLYEVVSATYGVHPVIGQKLVDVSMDILKLVELESIERERFNDLHTKILSSMRLLKETPSPIVQRAAYHIATFGNGIFAQELTISSKINQKAESIETNSNP